MEEEYVPSQNPQWNVAIEEEEEEAKEEEEETSILKAHFIV